MPPHFVVRASGRGAQVIVMAVMVAPAVWLAARPEVAVAMVKAHETVSVKVCVAVPTELVAVMVRLYTPAVVGVPDRVAVPLVLRV